MRELPIARALARPLAAALALLAAAAAPAATPTVFWVEPLAGTVMDRQVSKEVGERAGLIVLRAKWNNPDPDYTLKSVVRRLKTETKAPVLSYAWANRYTDAGRSEADLLKEFDSRRVRALGVTKGDGEGSTVDFLDVRDPDVRARVVGQFQRARDGLGVDGFAVDLSTRTPNVRPGELAKRCKQDAGFCPSYAAGMDALFADLRRGLGPNAFLAFNGLFNFAPGQLSDQAKLLAATNGAAIEFFGMDPKEKSHSFTADILPFLQIIPTLPADRSVLVFGRGPWGYNDYAEDYLWQRYLFASFLLAARPTDLFKYHATFQVPTRRGRSGGMDYYEDWRLDLGQPRGAARSSGGLYTREYSGGLVAVAPDDGRGGALRLPRAMFTPDGRQREGELRLAAGEGLILLNQKPAERGAATHVIDARTMAGWKWKGTKVEKIDGRDMFRVAAAEQPGEHDVLLDFERSERPFEHVEIQAKLLDRQASILAVAEVDDPKRQVMNVVVEVTNDGRPAKQVTPGDAAPFRAPAGKGGEPWPTIRLDRGLDKGHIGLGVGAFEGTGYQLRRWSHLRLVGAVAVEKIELSNRTRRVPEKQ